MSGSTTMEIGIIGLGNAGKPIAERLVKKGRRIKVYDLNRAPMEDLAKLGAVTRVCRRGARRYHTHCPAVDH